ncbi:MAG: hydroxymethylglutaryl-CoA lyase [Candidatus Tectomicrobia bacterium]
MSKHINICEVGTRDGFQIEPEFIPTDLKIEVVNLLTETGVPKIEVTSFVHPKAIPQLRDAEEVMGQIHRRSGTVYAALVPNDRGARRAIDVGVDELHTVLSASESHNLANLNMTVAESLEKLQAVAQTAHEAGVRLHGGISTALGCPFEGELPLAQVESIVSRLVDMGFGAIGIADTTGMANPAQVKRTLEHLVPKFPTIEWSLHTHNTRAMAIPNVLAAIECGVSDFDASVGGLGGCPYAPGATGNVCSEDLVHCLHEMGFETDIDLDKLIDTAKRVEEIIAYTLPGQVMKAGKSDRHYQVPHHVAERLAAL